MLFNELTDDLRGSGQLDFTGEHGRHARLFPFGFGKQCAAPDQAVDDCSPAQTKTPRYSGSGYSPAFPDTIDRLLLSAGNRDCFFSNHRLFHLRRSLAGRRAIAGFEPCPQAR